MCKYDVQPRGTVRLREETERSKKEMRVRSTTEICSRDVKLRGVHDKCKGEARMRGVHSSCMREVIKIDCKRKAQLRPAGEKQS